jgi:hypothetical protein
MRRSFWGKLKSLGIDVLRKILGRAADGEDYLEAAESGVAVAAAGFRFSCSKRTRIGILGGCGKSRFRAKTATPAAKESAEKVDFRGPAPKECV